MSRFDSENTSFRSVLQRNPLQSHWNRQAVLARRSALSAALQAGKRSYRQELADAFREAIDNLEDAR